MTDSAGTHSTELGVFSGGGKKLSPLFLGRISQRKRRGGENVLNFASREPLYIIFPRAQKRGDCHDTMSGVTAI